MRCAPTDKILIGVGSFGLFWAAMIVAAGNHPELKTPEPVAATGNKWHDKIVAEPPYFQARTLGRITNSATRPCTGTAATFLEITDTNSAVWKVTCSTGKSYVVSVFADSRGSSMIRGEAQTAESR